MPDDETAMEPLRAYVTSTIEHVTTLLEDLKALDEHLIVVLPVLQDMPESQRQEFVAKLCGYDPALPERLHGLIEGLADLLSGLTASDSGAAWLRHHFDRLAAGEAEEAA